MNDVKQVIVVRKDLNMRKGKLAAQVAQASMKFLLENNEAERGDEISVKLSQTEAVWLSGSFDPIIASVDSEDALQNLILRAQLHDIDVYPMLDDHAGNGGNPILTCAAFGPCDVRVLDKITGNLNII